MSNSTANAAKTQSPNEEVRTSLPKTGKAAGKKTSSAKPKKGGKGTRRRTRTPDQRPVLSREAQENYLKALIQCTWKNMELGKKCSTNEKLELITPDTLIVGVDVSSLKHDMRAFDSLGRELSWSGKAFEFENREEGFESALCEMIGLAVSNHKTSIVVGMEPTGHYWFPLLDWLVLHNITVVQVNPYAVRQTKEIEDNLQSKDDFKDPRVIAQLVRNGNFGFPYRPEDAYADLRGYAQCRRDVVERITQLDNRLHAAMAQYWPEYQSAFHDFTTQYVMELLERAQLPQDIVRLGVEGMTEIWRGKKLKGVGSKKAQQIYDCAKATVGCRNGVVSAAYKIQMLVQDLREQLERKAELEQRLVECLTEIPNAEKILAIPGIGPLSLALFVADLGDISRFDSAKEIIKLAGLTPVRTNDSGKHEGITKISRRGRHYLRYAAITIARNVVKYSPEFKALLEYYKSRANNPLKHMQAVVAIANKLIRVIFTILSKGIEYDPQRLIRDCEHLQASQAAQKPQEAAEAS